MLSDTLCVPMRLQLRVYVSGALSASSDLQRARRRYDDFADFLAQNGFGAYVPHHRTDPHRAPNLSGRDVYEQDRAGLGGCHVLVAFLDEPSFGVGAEIAVALTERIPVLALRRSGRASSRFVEGMVDAAECGVLIEYGDELELRSRVLECLRVLQCRYEQAP